jgi:hypothetical protein
VPGVFNSCRSVHTIGSEQACACIGTSRASAKINRNVHITRLLQACTCSGTSRASAKNRALPNYVVLLCRVLPPNWTQLSRIQQNRREPGWDGKGAKRGGVAQSCKKKCKKCNILKQQTADRQWHWATYFHSVNGCHFTICAYLMGRAQQQKIM